MTTQEIASRLVALCRDGKFEEAQLELYGKDVVSIEPSASEWYEKETTGSAAVLQKIQKFGSEVTTYHNIEVSNPLLAQQSFAVHMRLDVTMREHERMDMQELCVYKVKDGKIISEEFFL